MKNKLVITTACAAILASAATTNINAAPKSSPSPSASAHASPAAKTETTTRAIPFHGTISAVDQTAKTFTIAGKEKSRVFKVTHTTVITKSSAAATMSDIVANEQVSGSYLKLADGSLEAKTVKLGPKEEKTKKKSSKTEASPSPSASPKP